MNTVLAWERGGCAFTKEAYSAFPAFCSFSGRALCFQLKPDCWWAWGVGVAVQSSPRPLPGPARRSEVREQVGETDSDLREDNDMNTFAVS